MEKIWVWVKAALIFTFDIDISIENLLTENEKRTFRIKNLKIKLIKQAQCREIDTFYIN
jgi:hypothetical protein